MKALLKSVSAVAVLFITLLFSACSIQKKITKQAQQTILKDSNILKAHIGIALFSANDKKYIYNYNSNNYFIPASNMKLLTCYAAMKYLGDSLTSLRYVVKQNGIIEVEASGDPTLLHPDFKQQPVIDFLQKQKKVLLTDVNWKEKSLGFGWAWDDYNEDYMAERSVMPLYGNLVNISYATKLSVKPDYFKTTISGEINKPNFKIEREIGNNNFHVVSSSRKFSNVDIPFFTGDKNVIPSLLYQATKTPVEWVNFKIDRLPDVLKIHSQPTDSVLKIMMHRSDNFFAEQNLLMVSNELLGFMNDASIIDTLLKTDFKNLPQKPKWVDGSGLSRYNLVTPEDFITVLSNMKDAFTWNRITTILPTGDEGTLQGLYKNYAGKIFAKTGTLSNNLALSGYIISKKGKQYIFSILVNNHMASTSAIRKSIEQFLSNIIDKY